jgi:hypothetical protein
MQFHKLSSFMRDWTPRKRRGAESAKSRCSTHPSTPIPTSTQHRASRAVHFRVHRHAQGSHVHRATPPPHRTHLSDAPLPAIRFPDVPSQFSPLTPTNDAFGREEGCRCGSSDYDGGSASSPSLSRQRHPFILEFSNARLYPLIYPSLLRYSGQTIT